MKNLRPFLLAVSIVTLSSCGGVQAPAFASDTITARDGSAFSITFFKHASIAIEVDNQWIYIDPVGANANYAALPKADLVLVTHSHYDHLDSLSIASLMTPKTVVVADSTSAVRLGARARVMRPGERAQLRDYVVVDAVAAYNTSEGCLQFHPQERGDCGFVLTIGGTRIYIAGDSEPTPEMAELQDIDIAFLPVNQPYTMTVDQAVGVIKAMRPAIFYPYHYGEVEVKTDINRLTRELEGVTEVRVRPME